MFSLLPASLIALLFTSPALTSPTSSNDVFHNIAVHAPKAPEEPICCLRPLPSLDSPVEDDILLSFEDWKLKRLSEAKEQETQQPTVGLTHKPTANLSEFTNTSNTSQPSSQQQATVATDVNDNGGTPQRLAPHFRIPITDRFNYASLDCSARVHASHKSAKSASSILSSKKDKYMLGPCAEQKQFVIVELCEEIRIDTVQLANYEFFSGVFKDFSVSVAKNYLPTDPDAWTLAGRYRAQNVRGVQSFHTPTLRDFYRFIRIDFHSHYGSEYYCPVSLLRVYGLTQLEEWQWDTWEAENRAKRSAEEASFPVDNNADSSLPVHLPVTEYQLSSDVNGSAPFSAAGNFELETPSSRHERDFASVTTDILDSLRYDTSTTSDVAFPARETMDVAISDDTMILPTKTHAEDFGYDSARSHSGSLYNTHVSLSSSSSHSHSTTSDTGSSSLSIDHNPESVSYTTSSIRSSSAAPNVSALSTISPSYSIPVPPVSTSGESIYRTIMNRLTALEANTTLYTRYVEEQTAGMREVLRRLTEDIGRLEGIGKAQAQLHQRSLVELEKQTRRLEDEQRELLSRVDHLTDEVILEKRLGIAQLCLLLTVLVFMALTRGSRGEYAYPPKSRGSVRDWGRRTLSFSGDLMNRLRARGSTPPRAVGQAGEGDIAFPSMDSQASDEPPRSRVRRQHVAGSSRRGVPRPHTPTPLRTPTSSTRNFVYHRTGAPPSPSFAGPRPGIQRSTSGSMTLVDPVPKSAKRWARSAHLHEVKVGSANMSAPAQRRPTQQGGGTPGASTSGSAPADTLDVFDVDGDPGGQVLVVPASLSKSDTLGKGRMVLREASPLRRPAVIDLSSPPPHEKTLALTHAEGETSEGDAWVDTDVDGSECDVVFEGAHEGVRERTYTVPVTNSSL